MALRRARLLRDTADAIQALVQKFDGLAPKAKGAYNEANTVHSFVRPLFEALGWDFSNMDEVEAEKAIVHGRADFVFKLNNVTRFCVEVKSLRHDLTDDDREQAISYAYNKGVSWAILTNFERTQVLNAEIKSQDFSSVLFLNLRCDDYVSGLEDLRLISRQSAITDELDKKAEKYGKMALRVPIEKKLYEQLTRWRETLFNEVYQYNKKSGVTLDQTDQLIQKLFSRLVFIRTAEDRGLAGDHPLLSALHQWESGKKGLLDNIKLIFQEFAQVFDSDVFPQILDPWQPIWIDDYTLAGIIDGLYRVPGDFAKYNFARIEPDVLGQVYEQYLGYVAKAVKPKPKLQQTFFPKTQDRIEISAKRGKRKKGGIYYTPRWVTDYIVRQTIGCFIDEHSHDEILKMKIVDPACGSGSFLIRAYDELLAYHAKVKRRPVADLSWSERIEILTRNIFGVDLDPQAVEIARLNLLIRALAQRDLLPSLEDNIRCGNSLIFGTDEELEASLGKNFRDHNPFNWQDNFPHIANSGGFDIVIGNPPYVMELRDNKDIFRILKATPLGDRYYEPKMDIFYFFIEHGIDLLKSDGYLGYIIQQYWVSRARASKLRSKVFRDTSPSVLVDFAEYQVFRDAPGQHNMIAVFKKPRAEDSRTLLLQLKQSDVSEQSITKALASDPHDQDVFSVAMPKASRLYDPDTDKVYIVDDSVSRVLEKLALDSFNLTNAEIQQGVVTPQQDLSSQSILKLDIPRNHKKGEGIFVLSKSELAKLGLTKVEQQIIRPFHNAEDIDAYYYVPDVSQYLIYTPIETAEDIAANPTKYPNIRAHLDQYQPAITSDHRPYGIHRARQPEWFDDPNKIVCVRKTRYPKFCLVPEAWYGDQAVLIIRLTEHKLVSPRLILAILNSKIAHFWLYNQKRQGNQLQVDKEVLLHVPFPNAILSNAVDKRLTSRLVGLSKKIEAHKKQMEAAKVDAKDVFVGDTLKDIQDSIDTANKQVNQLVYSLYGLNDDEIQLIESVPTNNTG